jgi:hypothetical protein
MHHEGDAVGDNAATRPTDDCGEQRSMTADRWLTGRSYTG